MTYDTTHHKMESTLNELVDSNSMGTIKDKDTYHVPQTNKVQCVLDNVVIKVVQNALAASYANSAMDEIIINLEDICIRNDVITLEK